MAKEKTSSSSSSSLSTELATVNKIVAKLPLVITSDKEFETVKAVNEKVRSYSKAVDDFFKKAEVPLKEAIKKLKAEKDPYVKAADEILSKTRKLIEEWGMKKAKEAEEERKRLEREAKEIRKEEIKNLKESGNKVAAKALAATEVFVPAVADTCFGDGISFRNDVEVEIIDIDLVPSAYVTKELRLADVKRAYKEDNNIKIPGLKITPKKTLVNG